MSVPGAKKRIFGEHRNTEAPGEEGKRVNKMTREKVGGG